MRKVLFKWSNEREFTREGFFQAWGLEIYESGGVPASQTIAIIEMPDGFIITVYPNGVKFIDTPKY